MKKNWSLFNIKSKVLRDLGFLGFSNIIGMGMSAIFWLYLANLLGPDDFGEIQYYLGIAGIAYLIASIGAPNTITIHAAKNIKIHSALFLISIIGGLIAFLVLFGIFGRLDIGFMVLGFIIYDLVINFVLGKKEYSKYATHFLIQKILMLGLGIGFYYIFGPGGIIFGMALSYVHFIFIALKICRDTELNLSLLKSRSGFIRNNYLESAIGGVKGQIDKIVLVPLLGFTILGNYALAMQIYTILMIFSLVLFKYLLPQDATGVLNPYLKKISIIISIIISSLSIILTPIILPQLFPEYVDAVIGVQILSLSILPATMGYLYVSKFLGLEKSKFVLIGRIIGLSSLTAGMLILPTYYGVTGAALAFVISSLCQTGFFIIAKTIYVK